MKRKQYISFICLMAAIMLLSCISLKKPGVTAITISGEDLPKMTVIFANDRSHNFCVAMSGKISITLMNNKVTSGSHTYNVVVSIVIPDKGKGTYKMDPHGGDNNPEIQVHIIPVPNRDGDKSYNINGSEKGYITLSSIKGKTITGNFAATLEMDKIFARGQAQITRYQVKGTFTSTKAF